MSRDWGTGRDGLGKRVEKATIPRTLSEPVDRCWVRRKMRLEPGDKEPLLLMMICPVCSAFVCDESDGLRCARQTLQVPEQQGLSLKEMHQQGDHWKVSCN